MRSRTSHSFVKMIQQIFWVEMTPIYEDLSGKSYQEVRFGNFRSVDGKSEACFIDGSTTCFIDRLVQGSVSKNGGAGTIL